MLSHPCACYFLPQLTRSLIRFYSYSTRAIFHPGLRSRTCFYLYPLPRVPLFISAHSFSNLFSSPSTPARANFHPLIFPRTRLQPHLSQRVRFLTLTHFFTNLFLPSSHLCVRFVTPTQSSTKSFSAPTHSCACDFSARLFHKLVCTSIYPRTLLTVAHSFMNSFSFPPTSAICHSNSLFHELVFSPHPLWVCDLSPQCTLS